MHTYVSQYITFYRLIPFNRSMDSGHCSNYQKLNNCFFFLSCFFFLTTTATIIIIIMASNMQTAKISCSKQKTVQILQLTMGYFFFLFIICLFMFW